MQLVILAGGLGSRLSEETVLRPKPLVEIGGMPIIWHIMKIYAHHGIKDFIICLGYKGYMIKEYFGNLRLHSSDLEVDNQGNLNFLNPAEDGWNIKMIDTGVDTQTGGRLKKIADYIENEEFCMTYGDGLGDVNIKQLIDTHRASNCMATVTATHPPARFGALELQANKVVNFSEKPLAEGGWINGGFFVLNKKVLNLIDGDATLWEREPMQKLAEMGELNAYFHDGFWQPMDTLREKQILENMWSLNSAPWKIW